MLNPPPVGVVVKRGGDSTLHMQILWLKFFVDSCLCLFFILFLFGGGGDLTRVAEEKDPDAKGLILGSYGQILSP